MSGKDYSSFEENSCFFDELNQDEVALHNCNSINGYSMWPKIIDNCNLHSHYNYIYTVTISLNPSKNKEVKQSIHDLVTKVQQPAYKESESTLNTQQDEEQVDA
jgi:hypothetical protein